VDNYLRKLIEEGENQKLDFKFCVSDSRKIARTLTAFSNSDGGRLLIGVRDNGLSEEKRKYNIIRIQKDCPDLRIQGRIDIGQPYYFQSSGYEFI
jgi:predicted HTH transcriptional regulator